MAKKRPKRSRWRNQQPVPQPVYAVGDWVRVQAGVRSPLYPDIPLGGWTGQVVELATLEVPIRYKVAWNEATLAQASPRYFRFCVEEQIDPGSRWLTKDELERAEADAPVRVEQPPELAPPLDLEKPTDRIRAVFDLTSADPVPEPDLDNLALYSDYLNDELRFPFLALGGPGTEAEAEDRLPFIVHQLVDFDEINEDEGLLVEVGDGEESWTVSLALIEPLRESVNKELLQDYVFWFNKEEEEPDDSEEESEPVELTPKRIALTLVAWLVYAAGLGGAIATLLASQGPGAQTAFYSGAAILGGLGALIGYGFGPKKQNLARAILGPLLSGGIGAVAGAVLGVLAVGFKGTFGGGLVGILCGRLADRLGWRPTDMLLWTFFGAALGGLILALLTDYDAAVPAFLPGAMVGALVLFVWGIIYLALVHIDSRQES